MKENKNNIYTTAQFIEKNIRLNRWPTSIHVLRRMWRNRGKNGMQHVFIKRAGVILINEEAFYGFPEKSR